MPNQRAIAASLGLNQTTVSLALRGHPRIPEATRQRVLREAERLNYRSNAYVSTLMQHIRSGRMAKDKGCIAIIADAASEDAWLTQDVYRQQVQSMQLEAEKLGFYLECCFLQAPGMSDRRINEILVARGINAIILGAPRRSTNQLSAMDWSRYACVANGRGWQSLGVDTVSNHHIRNVEIAWDTLKKRGYQRIGMCLPLNEEIRNYWAHGYAGCQLHFPDTIAIPLMKGNPDEVPFSKFKKWYREWRPDAILCPAAHEMAWIRKLGLRVPEDLAVVCLVAKPNTLFSGVAEDAAEMGITLVDLVVAKIFRNEYGLPSSPKVTLIPGKWIEGQSLRPLPRFVSDCEGPD